MGGSEKLLNFHHLQMMKNIEGGGSKSNILSFQNPNMINLEVDKVDHF